MIYVFIYLVAIVIANLNILWFGPSVSILNAFLLIGLDLSIRDRLHDIWQNKGLFLKMVLLIVSGSIITIIFNWDALSIALASSIAFLASGLGDAFVYHQLKGKNFLIRSNGSNLAGSFLDSLLFPLIAFGFPVLWLVMVGQFIAKLIGGFMWAFLINYLKERRK